MYELTTNRFTEYAPDNSIAVHLVVSPLAHVHSLILDPHEADSMSLVIFVVPLIQVEIGGKLSIAIYFPMKEAALDLS